MASFVPEMIVNSLVKIVNIFMSMMATKPSKYLYRIIMDYRLMHPLLRDFDPFLLGLGGAGM